MGRVEWEIERTRVSQCGSATGIAAIPGGVPYLDGADIAENGGEGEGRNADRKYVKWLGVIFDDSLDFDSHWKSRIAKARKALGALSGVGGSQCEMCPGGWKKAYGRMIRSIATWGAELGWRGQKAWEKEFSRLQYQALRKATGTVQCTSAEKINQIARVESVDIHMDNNQARFVARCEEDPYRLGDMMPVGFGEGRMMDDELGEEGDGRRWTVSCPH